MRFLSGSRFGCNVALVHGLVREHRLPGDVTDRVDVRDIRPHLRVDADEATLVDGDPSLIRGNRFSIRPAPHRQQHEVVGLRAFRRLLAFERHV